MKKALMVFVAALVAAACCGLAACGETHEEITGTWAVVYRFTGEDGKAVNEYVNDEYVVFTEETFTYYKKDGGEYAVKLETSVKYHYGTSQSNKTVQGSTELSPYSLNKYSSYYITLGEYGEDTDFGLKFCGSKVMSFGRYSSSNAVYALLIKCDNLGDTPSGTDMSSISGNWVSGNKNFNVNNDSFKDYSKDSVNGFYTLSSSWGKTSAIVGGTQYNLSRGVYTYLFAEKDYIVEVSTTEYKNESGNSSAVSFESMTLYFRNAD